MLIEKDELDREKHRDNMGLQIGGLEAEGELGINWSIPNRGRGNMRISTDTESGRLLIDCEGVSRSRVLAVLQKAVLEAVFTDREQLVRTGQFLTLEGANAQMGFGPQRLQLPLYIDIIAAGEECTVVEMRWHTEADKVLSVWFKAEELVEGICSVAMLCPEGGGSYLHRVVGELFRAESLARGFHRAQLLSWEVVAAA